MAARTWTLGALTGCALATLALGGASAQQRPGGFGGAATNAPGTRRDSVGPGAAAGRLASRTVLAGSLLARLPIDDARQALALVPGVVLRGTDVGISTVPDVTIRGSRADQTAIVVDGAPARFQLLGDQGLDLPLAAISELSVESGVQAADAADGGGAGLGYRIRTGGSRLEGGVTVGGEAVRLPGAVGYTRIEAHGGGPLPFAPRVTFFAAGSLQGQPSAYRGAGASDVPTYELAGVDTVVQYADVAGDTVSATLPRFAQVSGKCGTTGNANTTTGRDIRSNYGYDCQGARRPLDWGTSRRAVAKLHYAYGSGSSVNVTGAASDFQRRYFPGSAIGAQGLYQGARARSLLVVLDWSHHIGRAGPGGVTVLGNLSYGSDESLGGPLAPTTSAATASPAFGIGFRRLRFSGLDVLPFPHLDQLIQDLRLGRGPLAPYGQRSDLAPSQSFRANPYGLASGWPTDGVDGHLTLAREHRLDGRLAVEWAPRLTVRVAVGADASRTDAAWFDGDLLSALAIDAFTARPGRTGIFASARFSGAKALVEAGVRADRFDAGADYPTLPARVFSSAAATPPPGGDTSYAGFVSRVFQRSRPRAYVSPRVRLAFTIDPRTSSWVGYGEQVVRPPLAWLYAHVNTDITLGGANSAYGADVRLAKTRLLEAGLRRVLSPAASLEVAIYQKVNAQPYWFLYEMVFDPLSQTSLTLPLLTRANDDVVGADALLEWRAGPAVSGWAAYSLSRRHQETPATVTVPAGRTVHALGAAVALEVPEGRAAGSSLGAAARGVRAELVVRAKSGLGYTADPINAGNGSIVSDLGTSIYGSGDSRLPWTWLADLRLTKGFDVGGARWAVYLEIRNLLNTATTVAAFTETRSDVNDAFRSLFLAPHATWLRTEPPAAALATDGTIDLTQACSAWRTPANCVALQRVENRFGDGDGHYTPAEQDRALSAYFDSIYGTWRFRGPARTARLGVEFRF